jgi:iron(III) transport system permease protein
VLRVFVSLPMLIPSVSIGMGVVQLLGNNGILTNLFSLPIGRIYGLPGIVLGSVLYALPVAYLMIVNILKFEDAAPYEAATVLGISKWRQFTAITLPYLRKPMISVIFSVFTLSFTDYGVPLMVGGKYKTLPVVMYQEVIGQLHFGKGCVYGSMLLIPAVIAFLLDLANQNEAHSAFLTRSFDLRKRKLRDRLASVYSWSAAIFCAKVKAVEVCGITLDAAGGNGSRVGIQNGCLTVGHTKGQRLLDLLAGVIIDLVDAGLGVVAENGVVIVHRPLTVEHRVVFHVDPIGDGDLVSDRIKGGGSLREDIGLRRYGK